MPLTGMGNGYRRHLLRSLLFSLYYLSQLSGHGRSSGKSDMWKDKYAVERVVRYEQTMIDAVRADPVDPGAIKYVVGYVQKKQMKEDGREWLSYHERNVAPVFSHSAPTSCRMASGEKAPIMALRMPLS